MLWKVKATTMSGRVWIVLLHRAYSREDMSAAPPLIPARIVYKPSVAAMHTLLARSTAAEPM